jgi:molybdenum cofactor cytidylyltransferase
MQGRPAIVVTAAGRGMRHRGQHHRLLEHLGSTTVLGMTLRHAVLAQLPLVVVTTEELAPHAARVVAARDVVVLPDASDDAGAPAGVTRGLGQSIAAGVAARGDARGWLILPADMPLVQPSSMLAVAAALSQHSVAYAQHRLQRGHPVAFSAELYSELVSLQGDDGARRVLARYPAHPVDVSDAGVLLDVDTEDHLRDVRARLARG